MSFRKVIVRVALVAALLVLPVLGGTGGVTILPVFAALPTGTVLESARLTDYRTTGLRVGLPGTESMLIGLFLPRQAQPAALFQASGAFYMTGMDLTVLWKNGTRRFVLKMGSPAQGAYEVSVSMIDENTLGMLLRRD